VRNVAAKQHRVAPSVSVAQLIKQSITKNMNSCNARAPFQRWRGAEWWRWRQWRQPWARVNVATAALMSMALAAALTARVVGGLNGFINAIKTIA